jgi:hypothetical protein
VLSKQQKTELCTFDRVVIALDKDASRKSIRLKERLEGRVDVKIVFLEEDIKNTPPKNVEELLLQF